jgi:hypothetical protein
VWDFIDLVYNQLKIISADKIAILRNKRGRGYAAGATSFKIEALIQTY